MNDKELDILFEQSAQRQKAVEQINRQVMQTVRRDMRRKALRKWVRLLGLCFGAPMLIVLYASTSSISVRQKPRRKSADWPSISVPPPLPLRW